MSEIYFFPHNVTLILFAGGGVGGDGRGLFYVIPEPRTYKKKNNLSSSPFVSLHTVTSITDLLDALRPPFRNCDGLKSY